MEATPVMIQRRRCSPCVADRRTALLRAFGRCRIPDFRCPLRIWGPRGSPPPSVSSNLPCGFAAARYGQLAPRIAQPLVDGVDREIEAARNRFRVVPAHDQAQGLLLAFGEGVKAFGCPHGHAHGRKLAAAATATTPKNSSLAKAKDAGHSRRPIS